MDWIVGDDWPGDFPADAKGKWTFRKLLEEQPDYSPIGPIKHLDWTLFGFGETRSGLLEQWNVVSEEFDGVVPKTVFNPGLPQFENTFLWLQWKQLDADEFWDLELADIIFDGMVWLLGKIRMDAARRRVLSEKLDELRETRTD